MEDVGTGAGHRAPPEVLRRLALAQRVSARAASHARVADAVLRRRAPKLLAASTRIAPPTELHPLGEPGGAARPAATSAPQAPAPTVTWVAETVTPADVAAPVPVPAPAQPVSEEAESFRRLMQQRYNMPGEVFEAMFSGNTPV